MELIAGENSKKIFESALVATAADAVVVDAVVDVAAVVAAA